MKRWTVELRPAAQRDLKKLDEGPQREAVELFQDLEEDPFSVPAIQLRAHPPGTMRPVLRQLPDGVSDFQI